MLLIRHADTDTAGRLCGSYDLVLSEAGRAQVNALLRRSPSCPRPAALYTSSLTRAVEVAQALALAWRLDPVPLDTVREIDCGRFEGIAIAELQRQAPQLWARNQAQCDEGFAWPGGESYDAFRRRVLFGLGAIAARHAGERIAVVTHAGVISQVLGAIRGRTAAIWQADRPDPLTATQVQWGVAGPEAVLAFNDADWY